MSSLQALQSGSAAVCVERIRAAHRVLVVCHVDPDGDAIGSMLGLGWFLQALGIPHDLVCESVVPGSFDFLPRTGPILTECADDCDLIVSVDCNDLGRLGQFAAGLVQTGVPVVNIDHHVTNPLFGAAHWVNSEAAATAEMVYDMAAPLGITLSADAALCLLTGVVTDTQAFRTPNTTPHTLETALQMMRAGASLNDVITRTVDSRGFASMCLWARVISEAKLEDGVLWAEVKRAHMKKCGTGREGQKGLINFLLTVREAKVVVLLTETGASLVDVSFRSVPGFEVSTAAVRLAGGRASAGSGLYAQDVPRRGQEGSHDGAEAVSRRARLCLVRWKRRKRLTFEDATKDHQRFCRNIQYRQATPDDLTRCGQPDAPDVGTTTYRARRYAGSTGNRRVGRLCGLGHPPHRVPDGRNQTLIARPYGWA